RDHLDPRHRAHGGRLRPDRPRGEARRAAQVRGRQDQGRHDVRRDAGLADAPAPAAEATGQARREDLTPGTSMEFRHLGASGLKVSAISYGNWLTHGSQVEEEQAVACVHRALDEGITTFDTADVYANTAAESVLGRALEGQRRESVEIMTK